MKYLKLQARFAPPTAGLLETAAGGLPLVQFQGLNTAKAVNLSGFLVDTSGNVTAPGTLAVTGTSQFTGAVTFTATPVFSSGQTEKTVNSALVGATVVLTATQSGMTCINVSTSGSPSWTLPTAANGLYFNFVCGNTTAGFTVTGGVIHAKTSATGTAITTTTTLTNTQGTAVVGDSIQIICDGTAWWAVAQTGIFAAS